MSSGPAMATLIGVDWDDGQLYQVSTVDGSMTSLGNLGIPAMSDLTMAPDGTVYGLTCTTINAAAGLYRIDLATAQATRLFDIDSFLYEGGLAVDTGGTFAYGSNFGKVSQASLFRIDLGTGVTQAMPPLTGSHDINGLVVRSDGMLIALDRVQSGLILIDPATSTWSMLAPIADPDGLGSVGAVTIKDGVGYAVTAALGAPVPGSSKLYSFDPFTGGAAMVGALSPAFDAGAAGIGGLVVPEPATAIFLVGSLLLLAHRRRR